MKNDSTHLSALPAINREAIAEQLRSVAGLTSVTITENGLVILTNQSERTHQITFDNIVYLSIDGGYVNIIVRSGRLYLIPINKLQLLSLDLHGDLLQKSGLELKEAISVVHDVWKELNDAAEQVKV